MSTKELEKILKALASKRRLDIIKILTVRRESVVGEIADKIKISLKATSQHLRILYSADILEKEKRGLEVYYRLADNNGNEIVKTVTKTVKQPK
jgi:DNA-binding transcriptional ArsR family regulator